MQVKLEGSKLVIEIELVERHLSKGGKVFLHAMETGKVSINGVDVKVSVMAYERNPAIPRPERKSKAKPIVE